MPVQIPEERQRVLPALSTEPCCHTGAGWLGSDSPAWSSQMGTWNLILPVTGTWYFALLQGRDQDGLREGEGRTGSLCLSWLISFVSPSRRSGPKAGPQAEASAAGLHDVQASPGGSWLPAPQHWAQPSREQESPNSEKTAANEGVRVPTPSQSRSLSRAEAKGLSPGCTYQFCSVFSLCLVRSEQTNIQHEVGAAHAGTATQDFGQDKSWHCKALLAGATRAQSAAVPPSLPPTQTCPHPAAPLPAEHPRPACSWPRQHKGEAR